MPEFETVTIPELDPLVLALQTFLTGSNAVGKAGKFTANDLVAFIAPYVSSAGSSGYIATLGDTLPTPGGGGNYFTITGSGTYGGIVASGILNIWSYVSGVWSLTKQIDTGVKKELGGLVGDGMVSIDVNGNATVTGELFVAFGHEFIGVTPAMTPIVGSTQFGLNWIYYKRSSAKIVVCNYTGFDIQGTDIILGYMFNVDPDTLSTPSPARIKVLGNVNFSNFGDLYFLNDCIIDRSAHTVTLSDSYYLTSGQDFVPVFSSSYATSENPTPFKFTYDPGLLLQSLIFDPRRLKTPGLNPFFFVGQATLASLNNVRQILVAQIVTNKVTTRYNFSEISDPTVKSIKSLPDSVMGTGTVDVKSDGSVEVEGVLYCTKKNGTYVTVTPGLYPIAGAGNQFGLNWIIFNSISNGIYLRNYTALPFVEGENCIGYLFNIDADSLYTNSKITVNGKYPRQSDSDLDTTGEIVTPSKMWFEFNRSMKVYKKSILRDLAEQQNDVVFVTNGEIDTDFEGAVRKYFDGELVLQRSMLKNIVSFASINPKERDYNYISNVSTYFRNANDLSGQTIKGQQIGDSLTNRGVSLYLQRYLNQFSITYNTFGTLDNSGKLGEGREGWTFSNFIGADNYHSFAGQPITRGNTGDLFVNPFLKLATTADKNNHPTWCFRNTGVMNELSYSTDPVKTGNFYIFDYAYYMTNQSIPADLQILTIALSTNDISLNGYFGVEKCAFGLNVMLTQIRAALPSVKIGVIPTPVYADTDGGNFQWSIAVDWINRCNTVISGFSGVDVIGVYAHMDKTFAFPTNDLGYLETGNNTKKYSVSDNIHFGMQGYLEYAPPLGNWIINVV